MLQCRSLHRRAVLRRSVESFNALYWWIEHVHSKVDPDCKYFILGTHGDLFLQLDQTYVSASLICSLLVDTGPSVISLISIMIIMVIGK
jgi:hypothetical protein